MAKRLKYQKNIVSLHRRKAQMAESVDALVSNTSGFTSMPVRSRLWVLRLFYNSLQVADLQGIIFCLPECANLQNIMDAAAGSKRARRWIVATSQCRQSAKNGSGAKIFLQMRAVFLFLLLPLPRRRVAPPGFASNSHRCDGACMATFCGQPLLLLMALIKQHIRLLA